MNTLTRDTPPNAQTEMNTTTTLLRLPSVLKRTALARATLYAAVKTGSFPAPVKIGVRAVAWRSTEVDAWIATRAPSGA